MLLEFGKANLIEKARQQPDKVHLAFDKIRTDGLMPTIRSIRSKLDQPMPLGYCNAGVVLEVGHGVSGFDVGDRVASNGAHAEIVCVPKHLCAKIPDQVSDEAASFTVIGAIALQGVRLAQPTLGEAVVVTGLGLVGLISVQLLRAHGCRVLGIDLDPARLSLARKFGAVTVDLSGGEDPIAAAAAFSRGRGVDAVVITASTKSNEPIHQAATMSRKRGRVVMVGVTGLALRRSDFYAKELSFQVSCSYGPGRYDRQYEEGGQDYPVGFVRWTAQRNFEAVLDMLSDERLDVRSVISHRFPVGQADEAYKLIERASQSLGVLIRFPGATTDAERELHNATVTLAQPPAATGGTSKDPVVGVIGSGNYGRQVLIPALARTPAVLKSIASQGGISAVYAGKKYGFQQATTDSMALIGDSEIDAILVATRHDAHAHYVCAALEAGKDVFVEKPLAIRRTDLAKIESTIASAHARGAWPLLMVGFNRRFSPLVAKIKSLLTTIGAPKVLIMTVNAGAVPLEHWTQTPESGGGRIIGEACHFIDLLRFLVDAPIRSTTAMSVGTGAARASDVVTFTLRFEDGSVGVVHYLANGHKAFPKERLEIFCAGRVLQLDNFRNLKGFGWPNFSKMRLWRQDKGNEACIAAFVEAVREGKTSPIPISELVEVTRVTFDIADQLA